MATGQHEQWNDACVDLPPVCGGFDASAIEKEGDLSLVDLRYERRFQFCVTDAALGQDLREFVRCPPDQAAHGGIARTRAVSHDLEKDVPARFKGVDRPKRHGR